MPAYFISHSHTDKPIARRVARRLGAYGVTVWLDERELRFGDVLGPVIEERIRSCDAVLVIASSAAAGSSWVEKEIAFAVRGNPPKSVCPVFVEDLKRHALFADHKGADALDHHRFEHVVVALAEAVLGAPLPKPSAERLEADLQTLAREEPALAPLIDECLEGRGLANFDPVLQAPFHTLDFAINALYDAMHDKEQHFVLAAAAFLFARRGAGMYTLEQALTSGRERDTLLNSAVGYPLDRGELDAALALLAIPRPRDDQALAAFIHHTAASMTTAQRIAAAALVTHPYRPPEPFAADAAFATLEKMPENQDVLRLWERWIRNGVFDEKRGPNQLAYFLHHMGEGS